jgi:hypothetical protein
MFRTMILSPDRPRTCVLGKSWFRRETVAESIIKLLWLNERQGICTVVRVTSRRF